MEGCSATTVQWVMAVAASGCLASAVAGAQEAERPTGARLSLTHGEVFVPEGYAPGEEGVIVMDILDAIYESADSGQPVDLRS